MKTVKTIAVLCHNIIRKELDYYGNEIETPTTDVSIYEAYDNYASSIEALEEEYYSFLSYEDFMGDTIEKCVVNDDDDDSSFSVSVEYTSGGEHYIARFWIDVTELILS